MVIRYYFVFILLALSILWAEGNFVDKNSVETKQIIIKGNKIIETSEYLDILDIQKKDWFLFWEHDQSRISRKNISTLKDTLKKFLDSKGFYNAKIKLENKIDKVVVKIHEGRPIMVSDLQVDTDFNIPPVANMHQGARFETARFIWIKNDIKALLLKAGYCNYDLDTKAYVDLDKWTVSVHYKLKKGELCRFGDTRIINKPEDISENVIRSRLRYKKGDIFSTNLIHQTFNALGSLDVFSSSMVTSQDTKTDKQQEIEVNNTIPIEVSLSLKDNLNLVKGGAGYDTTLGMRLQLYYERRNFIGDARKLTTNIHYANKSQYIKATLLNPAFMKLSDNYFDLFAKSGLVYNIYDAYSENKRYVQMKFIHKRDSITTHLGLGFDNIDIIKSINNPAVIDGNFLLLYPFASFIYDKRDSKINPKNGYYFSAYGEYGLDYKPSASSYSKFLLEGRIVKSFDNLTMSVVAKIGTIKEYNQKVPASKLFYAGGAYSNRAYGEHDLGYITSPVSSSVLGGKSWLNLSLEASYPIYGDNLYGAFFLDNTMINAKSYDFEGEVIKSIGFGIRYITLAGPLRVDVGANIEDIDQYSISFQIGQSF